MFITRLEKFVSFCFAGQVRGNWADLSEDADESDEDQQPSFFQDAGCADLALTTTAMLRFLLACRFCCGYADIGLTFEEFDWLQSGVHGCEGSPAEGPDILSDMYVAHMAYRPAARVLRQPDRCVSSPMQWMVDDLPDKSLEITPCVLVAASEIVHLLCLQHVQVMHCVQACVCIVTLVAWLSKFHLPEWPCRLMSGLATVCIAWKPDGWALAVVLSMAAMLKPTFGRGGRGRGRPALDVAIQLLREGSEEAARSALKQEFKPARVSQLLKQARQELGLSNSQGTVPDIQGAEESDQSDGMESPSSPASFDMHDAGATSGADSESSGMQSAISGFSLNSSSDGFSAGPPLEDGLPAGGTATPLAFQPRRRYPRKMPPRPEEGPRYPVYRPNGSDDSDQETPSLPDPEALMEQRAAALRDRVREQEDPLFVYDSDSAAELDRFEQMLGGPSECPDENDDSVSDTSSLSGPDVGWFDRGLLSDDADSEMLDDEIGAGDALSDEGIASSESSETMPSDDMMESEADDEDVRFEPVMKKPAASDDKDEVEEPVRKRPARRGCLQELCVGQGGTQCIFNITQTGRPARHNHPASRQCLWCNVGRLQHALDNSVRQVTQSLKKLIALSGENSEVALQAWARLPTDRWREELRRRVGKKNPDRRCIGRSDMPCRFHTAKHNEPARVHSKRQCMLCDDDQISNAYGSNAGLLTKSLGKLRLLSSASDYDTFELALSRIAAVLGEDVALDYRNKAMRKARVNLHDQWSDLLWWRRCCRNKASREEKRNYKFWLADEQKRVRSKLGDFAEPAESDDWRPVEASRFDQWARKASWAMCYNCGRMLTRPFQPVDMSQPQRRKATIAKCKHCRSGIGYFSPNLEDIPEDLRRLSPKALDALRPLMADPGAYERHRDGYRVHTDMTRFFWRPQPVKAQIRQLESRKDRRRARAAYVNLMARDNTAYGDFVQQHEQFLKRNRADLSKAACKMRIQTLETVGIECAVWPHLYPYTAWCETFIRKQDARRVKRDPSWRRAMRAADRNPDADDSSEEDDRSDEDDLPLRASKLSRHSAKASYMAKVLSGVVGYGNDYTLFQFVYDLWLWSTVGGARNASGAPIRVAMGGKVFSPEYWRTRHGALLDLVRQLGYPSLFITVAPYEFTFPYHDFILDEMVKALRTRTYLPAAETLHIAHVLAQSIIGLLAGANRKQQGRSDRCWKNQVFRARDDSGEQVVVNFFARLEYQDGKRKRVVLKQGARGPMNYHGRGTVHVHALFWFRHMEKIGLESIVKATMPDEAQNPRLHALVSDCQRSYGGSGWPQRDGPSVFDERAGVLRLHHGPSDANDGSGKGVRAYIEEVLSALGCHMDVQGSDGRGMLLKYVSSYVAKFSDQFAQEWLNEHASAFSLARRILRDYHPLEPEMWLQLSAQQFPQVFADGTLKRFVPSTPFDADQPKLVQLYMESAWRRDDMPLLEWLRKANSQGEPYRYLRKMHRAAGSGEPFDAWVQQAETQGQVMVSLSFVSRYNDKYFGQWLLMHQPFRSLEDVWHDDVNMVPEEYRNFALALRLRPDHWRSIEAIRNDMELEGCKDAYIETVVAMVQANTSLIDRYFDGRLNKEDPIPNVEGFEYSHVRLAPEQRLMVSAINRHSERALRLLNEDDPAGVPSIDSRKALAVTGPAGSGKSTCIETAVWQAHERGARVLIAAPTGRLASTLRSKFPGLDVDTIHGAFLIFRPEAQTIEMMQPYELVVIEEFAQISQYIFERLLRLWDAADRRPALVFCGDFCQLQGADPTKPNWSEAWSNGMVHHMNLRTMRRCKCSSLRWKLELLRAYKPTASQLRDILKKHRAPKRENRPIDGGGEWPTAEEIAAIFTETPETTFVTLTRRAAAWVNDAAVKLHFGHVRPLDVLPGEPEQNASNYDDQHMVACEPSELPIYAGLRLYITRNANKSNDFVNGMGCEVIERDQYGVLVLTDTGRRLLVHPMTDPETKTVYFPLRLGYATTLHKVQGATLAHMTMWLDKPWWPAAAYVALSRVQYDASWRFVGDMKPEHFVPAEL
jgi:hypothetical protein